VVFSVTGYLMLDEFAFIVALVVKLDCKVRAAEYFNGLCATVSVQIYDSLSELGLDYDRARKLNFELRD
jgi:hypothetical protein